MEYTVPLVFHRLVHGNIESHEDVSVPQFRRMLSYIRDSWTLLDGGRSRGPRGLWLITFDDGNSSDVDIALPMLAETGARAVFFVVTSWIGKKGYLDWNQVRTLYTSGMEIGSHSVSHPNLAAAKRGVRRMELLASREIIEDRIGAPVGAFAFPFGLASREAIHDVHAAGYTSCCTSRHGRVRLPAPVVPRNAINGRMTWDDIDNTLEASLRARMGWLGQDIVKAGVKRVAGAAGYRAIRRTIFGGAP